MTEPTTRTPLHDDFLRRKSSARQERRPLRRLFALLLCGWLLSTLSAGAQTADTVSFIRPPFLREGDTVAVVAISSQLPKKRDTTFIRTLESWGLHVRLGEHLYCRDSIWFAGTDRQRADDLQRMLDDTSVKAILFYRGGYGAIRILDSLNLETLREHPKWLVGYSDITVMHYALQKTGIESIHGAMPVDFLRDTAKCDTSALSLQNALWGRVDAYRTPPHPLNTPGRARGRLTGGNLSLICALNGTDMDNTFDRPSVLLIEEVGENISRIDRMLQTLKRSGKLERLKAIVVGHFTDITGEERWGGPVDSLIHTYTSALDIPVLFGFPSGHESPNYSLFMGREVSVTVTEEGGTIEFL